MNQEKSTTQMEEIVSLCKRRGFVMPSAEIYGGTGSVWDFGPLGVLLKNNIKNYWIETFVQKRREVVLIESALLTKREVLVASGHESEFTDPLVECKKCNGRFREDHLEDKTTCPNCQAKNSFGEAKKFNMMFKTYLGPVEASENLAYLRPETAQGMFTNFKNIIETSRKKLPFGIAQVGKAFRNEITTGNYIFRDREFEQMEIEYFVKPGEDDKWFDFWRNEWEKFLISCGLSTEKLHRYDHPKEALSHYSKGTTDFEYDYPFGRSEVAGVANRTDFDLSAHEKHSGQDMKYFEESTKEKFWPYVIEPTLGVERLMLALLVEGFEKTNDVETNGRSSLPDDKKREPGEIVLHLNPKIAPIKAAILPLVKKDKLPEIAQEIYNDLSAHWQVDYDESGSIGRRYRRQDEIGTPFCITVDFQSIEDQTVTLRDRYTMKQERIKISELQNLIQDKIS